MVRNIRVELITPKVLALGVLSLMMLTACQQNPTTARFTSEQGVAIESLLPGDLTVLIKIGTNDQQQIANLKTLNGYFPNNPLGTIVKEFNDGFKEGTRLDEFDLDYEKDLLPILKEKSELYVAIVPVKGVASEDTLGAVSVVTLGDPAKLDQLFQKQVDSGDMQKDQYDGINYYFLPSAEESFSYLTRIEDVFYAASDLDILKQGIDSYKKGENALADNQVYQRALKDYKPAVVFLFGDFSHSLGVMEQVGENGLTVAENLEMLGVHSDLMGSLESQSLWMTIEKEGIRLAINVKGKADADLREVLDNSPKAYLIDKISANNPVMYAEGYNFSKSYETFAKIAESDPNLEEGLGQMEEFLSDYGLNFKEDVLSFLGKGYAFVLEDTGSLVPAFGLYVDGSGNVAGAEKTMRKINESVTALWEQAKIETPEATMIISQEEVLANRLWKFKINLDTMLVGQPLEMVKKFSGQKLELYYGLLADDTVVFAMKPDLEKVYGQSSPVAQNAEFKRALGFVNNDAHGVSYFSPLAFIDYVDRLIELAKSQGVSTSELGEYEMIKSYIRPLKSLIMTSQTVEKEQQQTEVFLHIAR